MKTETATESIWNLIRKILPNEYNSKGEKATGYSYTYDKQGNIISIIAPNGTILETNIYDSEGNLLQRLDGVKSGINCEYDLAGRRKNITTQSGAKQEFTYDAQGNITGIVDGNKNRTEYRLDKWGRITEIIKPNGTSEYFSYDYAGNIIETVDGNGNKIRYKYNLLNKLQEIIDQTGEKDYFTYDIEGRVRLHTDRRGNEVQYSYNFYDSLTEKLERKSGLRESYEYYLDGSIKSAIAEGMRYSYSYYANGKLKEKSVSGKRLLSYEYDLNGNKIKQTDVTGKTTEYIYDELDQLLEIHDGGKCITAFKYNDDGTIKEALSANGMKNLYGYDTDKNLTSLDINFNGEVLAQNKYAYDRNGNRTEKRQLRGTTYYTYDSINQLINVKYPDYEEQLFYDKAGNRSKRIVNDVTEHYLYDKRNRLIRQVFQKPTGTTAKHYIYDNAGSLMNDGERSYKNDGFNRVTQVTTNKGQVQINRYDAEGLRYEMEENKKLVQFIFNENREVVVEQSDSDIKRLIRSYDLWASECEPEKTWYHYAGDEQGSTIFITDEEKICNEYDYDAWGNLTTCEEIIPNRFLYTGQQFDQITQQYYLRARYYNPVIARFTKEDVYRGDGLNLYTYCDNNPVIYYDPSGYKKRAAICEKNIYNRLKNTGHYTDERAYALSVAYTRARNANPNMTAAEAFKFATGKDTFGNRVIDPIKEYKNINPKFFEEYPFNIPELAVEMPKVDKIYGSCADHAGVTSQGYLRDAQAYWMAVYNRCPKAFSEANLDRMFNPIRKVIKNNNFHSPLNDKTFRNSFPQYDIPGIRSDVLHHHHVGGRGQAIPVPSSLHRGSGGIHTDEENYGIIYKRR